MKQHIAKLLVFLMLMTTMIVPADLSFAESENETTTQAEEPSVQPENQQNTTETKAAQQSTNDKKDIAAAEEQQLEETVTERMEFLYIESKELAAPGTQNIVVSWKEAIDDIQNMVLVYENEQGKTFTLKESKRNDESIVFTKDFTAAEAGTYKIKGVQYFVGNEEKYFAFDDVEIAASFKVVKGQTIEDDAIAKVEVESNGAVDKKEVNAEIKDAVTSTDAAPKVQTKARSAKSSNIVVVLDPGHGGKDSGATRGSVYEKTINFKVASYCKAELEKYHGVTVYMTRTGDTNPSLEARARFAASKNADILVSIHQNSGSSSSRGAEVYYPNKNYKPAIGNSGKAVANSIQKELVSLGLNNRGTKIRNTANGSTYADGSYADYYGIIRNAKKLGVPGIIVEHAFLSNTRDYNTFLNSDSKLKKLGVADATGIAKAFGLSTGKWINTSDGIKYQFGDGTYACNQQIDTKGSVNERYFYFDENGYLVKGIYQNINNKIWYYANEKTGGIQTTAGFVIWNGNKYYVTKGGAVAVDKQVDTGGRVNQRFFYLNEKGHLVKGIYKNPHNKIWYYANEKTGGIQTTAGFVTWNGNKYYVTKGGAVAVDKQVDTGGRVNQRFFYLNEKGHLVKGIYKNPHNKIWYYANEKTGGIQTTAGFVTWNGNKYYVTKGGAVAVNRAIQLGDTKYYFDQNGKFVKTENIGTKISGKSQVGVAGMVRYYQSKKKTYPAEIYKTKGASDIESFCKIYYEEAQAEGIKAEVAFCQAMKETGWLQFGGDVKASQCNFAGIGATGGGVSGASFKDVRTGVRAQIQHLKAYANALPLNNACVDPRFKYVKRGSAPYVEWLGKNANPNGVGWAPAANYGTSIVQMMNKLLSY